MQLLRALPKAELHVHLEGSIDRETLLALEPSLTPEEIDARYAYSIFPEFLMAYKWVNGFIRRPEDYALILRKLVERQVRDGCVAAEINLSIGVMLWRNLPFDEFFDAAAEEAARLPIPVHFIFDAVRQFGLDAAERVAGHAIECAGRGVAGFGIGGDETSLPLAAYRPVIDRVLAHGLLFLPHAGEVAGAGAVREAVELGAARIGHGIGAAADAALMRELAARRIPLEISITSNVRTGAVASLAAHPVRRLFDAGVPLTLNTDDPPMFGCTLVGEYLLAAEQFGFTADELAGLARNSLRFLARPGAWAAG